MNLTAKDVAEILELLEQSSFDEFSLEVEGLKLSVRRGAAADAEAPTLAAAKPAVDVQKQAVAAEAPITPTRDPNIQEVTAPLLGTFYRAPKPGAAPFVELGSMVEADTIVGILEVMKLMNTVRAGVSGRVSEIGARDGALVEFGEILMRVQRAE